MQDVKPFVKRLILPVLMALTAISVSGCMNIRADELYRLPQASEEYLKLQVQINAVLDTGAEFSPPTGGPNKQSVQLKDINGDGVNEAIVFFSVPVEGTLKIYIFERTAEDYTVADIIEGAGTALESIRYADMDGDGVMELVAGWQMGVSLKHMSIYSLRELRSVMLAGADYTALTVCRLEDDGRDQVVALRLPSSETTGSTAEVFSLMRDGEVVGSTARLSDGIESISRVLTGKLTDGSPAIFVEGEGKFAGGSLVTDICAYQNGSFMNITLDRSGLSAGTVRARSIYYCTDINKDGIVEVPAPRLLKAQSETPYYATDWYAYGSSGAVRLALTTYHNNNDEWYLILPFNWRGRVSVRRVDEVSGERTVVFSYIAGEDGPYEDFLKIHKLTGDNREERAKLPGRHALLSEDLAVYVFELLAAPNSFGLTFDETLIKENFRLIYADWITGAVQ